MRFSLGKIRYFLVFVFVLLVVNSLVAQRIRSGEDQAPDGKHGQSGQTLPAASPIGKTVVQGNGINYHGGPVLKGSPVPIYIIWYGNWNNGPKPSDSQTTVNLIQGFLGSNSLGGSSYEAINTTYSDNTGNVSGHLNFSGAVFDNYSQGTRFGDKNLKTIVSTHVGHDLPSDANA
ncbi:MAG TPA: hypothetical protein VLN58_00050, partial [Verrucomicrobiae bacterium]|nr:hypothetical protein [Verrucomicrobiae bacterium]